MTEFCKVKVMGDVILKNLPELNPDFESAIIFELLVFCKIHFFEKFSFFKN